MSGFHTINCLCGSGFECEKWQGGKCPDCGLVWDWVEAYRPDLTTEMEAAVVAVAKESKARNNDG